jgi:hypothetical protein
MGGITDTPDGFYRLTRGGLTPPWIEVNGTGRSIEWTSLIEGLKTIAREEAIIR